MDTSQGMSYAVIVDHDGERRTLYEGLTLEQALMWAELVKETNSAAATSIEAYQTELPNFEEQFAKDLTKSLEESPLFDPEDPRLVGGEYSITAIWDWERPMKIKDLTVEGVQVWQQHFKSIDACCRIYIYPALPEVTPVSADIPQALNQVSLDRGGQEAMSVTAVFGTKISELDSELAQLHAQMRVIEQRRQQMQEADHKAVGILQAVKEGVAAIALLSSEAAIEFREAVIGLLPGNPPVTKTQGNCDAECEQLRAEVEEWKKKAEAAVAANSLNEEISHCVREKSSLLEELERTQSLLEQSWVEKEQLTSQLQELEQKVDSQPELTQPTLDPELLAEKEQLTQELDELKKWKKRAEKQLERAGRLDEDVTQLRHATITRESDFTRCIEQKVRLQNQLKQVQLELAEMQQSREQLLAQLQELTQSTALKPPDTAEKLEDEVPEETSLSHVGGLLSAYAAIKPHSEDAESSFEMVLMSDRVGYLRDNKGNIAATYCGLDSQEYAELWTHWLKYRGMGRNVVSRSGERLSFAYELKIVGLPIAAIKTLAAMDLGARPPGAQEEEPSENVPPLKGLKLGDKVRIINAGSMYYNQVGIIQVVNGGFYTVSIQGVNYVYEAEDIELCESQDDAGSGGSTVPTDPQPNGNDSGQGADIEPAEQDQPSVQDSVPADVDEGLDRAEEFSAHQTNPERYQFSIGEKARITHSLSDSLIDKVGVIIEFTREADRRWGRQCTLEIDGTPRPGIWEAELQPTDKETESAPDAASQLEPSGEKGAVTLLVVQKPSARQEISDTYWRFAFERQEIFYKRLTGEQGPWTADPILQQYKFCNTYRASDRVSQYLIKNVIYQGSQKEEEVIFRTLLFRLFNKIETWEYLTSRIGELTLNGFDFKACGLLLDERKDTGSPLFSNAYIMPTFSAYGTKVKHQNVLALIEDITGFPKMGAFFSVGTAKEFFQLLTEVPGLGNFLAYQLATDLNYSEVFYFDENHFTVPGPGAERGIAKCFSDLGGLSQSDIIMRMVDTQQAEFERLGLPFRTLGGRALHAIDCQNLFCEVDKYCRVAFPDVESNRSKIKNSFKQPGEPIDYFYPPKWNLAPLTGSANEIATQNIENPIQLQPADVPSVGQVDNPDQPDENADVAAKIRELLAFGCTDKQVQELLPNGTMTTAIWHHFTLPEKQNLTRLYDLRSDRPAAIAYQLQMMINRRASWAEIETVTKGLRDKKAVWTHLSGSQKDAIKAVKESASLSQDYPHTALACDVTDMQKFHSAEYAELVEITPAISYMRRNDGQLLVAYIGFQNDRDATRYLAWMTKEKMVTEFEVRTPNRIANCHRELKVWGISSDSLNTLALLDLSKSPAEALQEVKA